MRTEEGFALSIFLFGVTLLASFITLGIWGPILGNSISVIPFAFTCLLLGFFMLLTGYTTLKLYNELSDFIFKISGYVLVGFSLIYFVLVPAFIGSLMLIPDIAYIPFFLLVLMFLSTVTLGTGLMGISIKKLGKLMDKKNIRALGDLFVIGSFLSVLYLFGVLILFISSLLGFQKLKKL